MVSSVLTLATIALDQFVAVAFPIHARFTSRLQPSWVISGVWVLAATASIPFLLHKKHIELRFSDHVKLSCSEGRLNKLSRSSKWLWRTNLSISGMRCFWSNYSLMSVVDYSSLGSRSCLLADMIRSPCTYRKVTDPSQSTLTLIFNTRFALW